MVSYRLPGLSEAKEVGKTIFPFPARMGKLFSKKAVNGKFISINRFPN
jgi:hypothetical protein